MKLIDEVRIMINEKVAATFASLSDILMTVTLNKSEYV
jgi:hypothetical protein